jgi:dimethylsulfone monooxygenase
MNQPATQPVEPDLGTGFSPAAIRTPQPTESSSAMLASRNDMMLGVFCLNISGGMSMSAAAPNVLSWADTAVVAKIADKAGWEFLLSLGKWRGHGGRTNANAEQYETFTWAAGMGAITERIHLFATCHVPVYHPTLVARIGATVDAISYGRLGINIVAGYNELEFGMFGITQNEHDDRYAAADEWVTIIERLWTEDDELDFAGKYYTVKRGYAQPKPVQKPRPLIISAGTSPAGLDFALRKADFNFQGAGSFEMLEETVKRTRARAAELEVTPRAITHGLVVLADTEKEAWRYYDWVVDEAGDKEAASLQIERSIAGGGRSIDPDVHRSLLRNKVSGWGGRPLVGTADQIVDQLLEYRRIGYCGIALGWVDMIDGIGEFNEKVLPLLEQAGLRTSAKGGATA